MELLNLIGVVIRIFLAVAYCVAFLIVLLISVVYFVGYLYDSIFGNCLYDIGKYVAKRYCKIRNNRILRKVKRIIEPKKWYMRYETPLCTYCFSYTALVFIYEILESIDVNYGTVIAFFMYIAIYFFGMYRKYKDKEAYDNALENNLCFLKLSFVPLTFLITIIGFLFTVVGYNIRETDFEYFINVIMTMSELNLFAGYASDIWIIITYSVILLILFYIFSIPMQLISYYIILIIKYFRKYGKAYVKLINLYKKILHRIGK